MGLYLGKKKLCSYNEKKVTQNSMKMLFDSMVGVNFDIYSEGNYPPFYSSTATTMEGWWLPSDTEDLTSTKWLFCYCTNLTAVPAMSLPLVTTMYGMFQNCSRLTSFSLLNTSNVENMQDCFYGCSNLTEIPAFDVSNVSNFLNAFYGCSKLMALHIYNIRSSLNISVSTKFTESALVEILNNLASVTSTQTLTMGSTNLAKLTDDEKAIATEKGWTLK